MLLRVFRPSITVLDTRRLQRRPEGGNRDFDLPVVRDLRRQRLERDVRYEHRMDEEVPAVPRADAQDLVANPGHQRMKTIRGRPRSGPYHHRSDKERISHEHDNEQEARAARCVRRK